mgnify:CR=1 FL=1|jgi:hypothetical protein
MTWLMALNAAVALGSMFFGLVALFRPQAMPGRPLTSPGSQMTQPSEATTYFARMYAARAVPFGIATAAVCILLPSQAAIWLLAAGAIELLMRWLWQAVTHVKRHRHCSPWWSISDQQCGS